MIRKTAFAVLSLAFAALASAAPQRLEAQRTLTCESRNSERTYCPVNASGNAHLVLQMSEAACVRGRSWGTDSRGIWVSRGCRAQFAINNNPVRRDENRSRDDVRNDRNDRAALNQAERVCRNAVRDRYRGVRSQNVSAAYRGTDRSGQYVVNWRAGNENGTCTVSRSGSLRNFRVARR